MVARGMLLPVMRYIKRHSAVSVPAATLLKAAMQAKDEILFHTTYRFVQAMHYELYANHRRSSPNFLPQDGCQEYSERFNTLYGGGDESRRG